MLLQDLLLIANYFEKPFTALYEEDLKARYGQEVVTKAICSGLLEHRWVPCGRGQRRCVCWLSEKGRESMWASRP